MAAYATQRAPQETKSAPRSQTPKTPEKKGFKEKLHDLPQAAGMAIMVVLLALSLVVGNARALQSAAPKDFIRQGDVQEIIEDRVTAAGNALMIAKRAGLSDTVYTDVQNACDRLEKEKTARGISEANESLTTAVSDMAVQAGDSLDAENKRLLQSALDDFTEQGSFLRQEARSYNKEAEKAEAVYEKLLLRFLFDEPDVYTGVDP